MLVSKFNLQPAEEEEEVPVEVVPEGETHPETVAEEEKLPDIERVLKKSEVSVGLSMLGKTAQGDGYTYLKASCTGLKLTEISAFKCFRHLQFVDLSNNFLTIDRLQVVTDLPFLVLIHADQNLLSSAALKRCKYLQVIIMNQNQIKSVQDVYQPELSTLELGHNDIHDVFFDSKMPPTLKCLDFRHNKIQDLINFNFPNLDSLYLASNKISNLMGLERLVNLRILHLRHNPIRFLNGFCEEQKKLQYINFRNCKIATLRQVRKLRCLQALEAIVLKGCPYMGGSGTEDPEAADEEEDPETRVEVLAALARLKRLNKGVFSPDERKEANDLMKQWLEDGEKDEEEEVVEEGHGEEEEEVGP